MKLYYLANYRLPTEKAHGVQIVKMCEAFADQGLDVTLILPERYTPIDSDIYTYYQVKNNFNIKKVPAINLIFLDFLLGKIGFWLESWYFAKVVKKIIQQEKPDIVFTREHILARLVGKFFKNIFLEAHFFSPSNFYLSSISKVKGLIVITKKLKELHYKFNKNILVAADGVDIKQFALDLNKHEAREKLDLPQGKKIILYIGHLYHWKGASTLARASKYLPEDYQIYFVGGTKNDIITFKSEAEKQKWPVKIMGHHLYKEMPLWLATADVLVLTGNPQEVFSQYFTSPMKLFEYMASKRPIVAIDLPSFREILNEQNSVLVASANCQALSDGIKKVVEDNELAQNLIKQAFQDVQKYSWLERSNKIKEFIIQTINN